MRNDEYTRGIVDELQNEMFDLMANKMDKLPKLMQQALNYLHKFWKQVFAYRNDGEYSIDNLAAERAIRPQTIQRKGSLFLGSVQGALRIGNVQYLYPDLQASRSLVQAIFQGFAQGREIW